MQGMMLRSVLVGVVSGLIAGAVSGLTVAVVLDDDGGAREADTPALLTVHEAAMRVLPSVVTVEVAQDPVQDGRGRIVERGAEGTGLVVDALGYVLTNAHVVEEASHVSVVLAGGEEREADVVWTDAPFLDVAVLRIAPGGLTPVFLGDSATLVLGEPVLAVGNVLGSREPAVTVGVVSDPDARFPRDGYVQESLIQTDAALNHGNSGGALVTLRGEVVGLTTTIVRETEGGQFVDGVGFALQMNVVMPVVRAIIETGRYPRPDLGVVRSEIVDAAVAAQLELGVDAGALLIEITRQGPLAKAGIRPGDVVVAMGGMAVTADDPFQNVLGHLQPGVPVEVVYVPHGEQEARSVTVTPDDRRAG